MEFSADLFTAVSDARAAWREAESAVRTLRSVTNPNGDPAEDDGYCDALLRHYAPRLVYLSGNVLDATLSEEGRIARWIKHRVPKSDYTLVRLVAGDIDVAEVFSTFGLRVEHTDEIDAEIHEDVIDELKAIITSIFDDDDWDWEDGCPLNAHGILTEVSAKLNQYDDRGRVLPSRLRTVA